MRPICSWLLLLLISLQWVGGHLCFKVMHSVVAEMRMNAAEEAVAAAMKAETGVDGHIRILKEEELEISNRLGYSNVFVFSKEIDGQTVHFTVEPAPLENITYGYVSGDAGNLPDQAHRVALLKRLFSGFFLYDEGIPKIEERPFSSNANFSVAPLSDLFEPSIPLPPPKYC